MDILNKATFNIKQKKKLPARCAEIKQFYKLVYTPVLISSRIVNTCFFISRTATKKEMTPVEINYYTDVRCQRPILLRNCCTQLNHYICLMSARKCQRNIIPLCPAVTVRCSFLCLCLKYPKNIYYIKLVTLDYIS